MGPLHKMGKITMRWPTSHHTSVPSPWRQKVSILINARKTALACWSHMTIPEPVTVVWLSRLGSSVHTCGQGCGRRARGQMCYQEEGKGTSSISSHKFVEPSHPGRWAGFPKVMRQEQKSGASSHCWARPTVIFALTFQIPRFQHQIWPWVALACSSLEQGLASQPEAEAGLHQWKHQILATIPAVSDKGPGPLALQKRIPQKNKK